MSKKTREKRKLERQRIAEWHRYYENCIAGEAEKRRGYEELAQVHSAYISILLKKLGATKDHMIIMKPAKVTEALKKCETRAVKTEEGWGIYYEDTNGE